MKIKGILKHIIDNHKFLFGGIIASIVLIAILSVFFILYGNGMVFEYLGLIANILGILAIFPAVGAFINTVNIEKYFQDLNTTISLTSENEVGLAVSVGNPIDIDVARFLKEDNSFILVEKEKIECGNYFVIRTYKGVNLVSVSCEKNMPVNDENERYKFLREYHHAIADVSKKIQESCDTVSIFVGGPSAVLTPAVGNVFSNRCDIKIYHYVGKDIKNPTEKYVLMGVLEKIISN